MGMFDDVEVEVPCPICGKMHKGWQTKYGACLLNTYRPGSFISDNLKYIRASDYCIHRITDSEWRIGTEGLRNYASVWVWMDLKIYLDENGCIPEKDMKYEIDIEIKTNSELVDIDFDCKQFNEEMLKLEQEHGPQYIPQIEEEMQEAIWFGNWTRDMDVNIARDINFEYEAMKLNNFDDLIEWENYRQERIRRDEEENKRRHEYWKNQLNNKSLDEIFEEIDIEATESALKDMFED